MSKQLLDIVNEGFDAVADKLEAIVAKMATLEAAIETKASSDDIPSLDPIREELKEVKASIPSIDPIKEELKEVKAAIPSLDPINEELKEVKASIPSIDPIQEELKEVKAAIPSLDPIHEELKEVKSSIPSLEPIKEELKSVKASIPSLDPIQKELESVKASIPEVEPIHKEVEALKKGIDAVEKLVEMEVKEYTPGAIYREGTYVNHHFGDTYKAVKDTIAEPTPESEDWKLVKRGLRFRGGMKKGFEYQPGDLFVKDFSLFMQTGSGAKLIAARGKAGESGRDGRDGAKGADGKDGKSVTVKSVEMDGLDLKIEFSDGTVTKTPMDPILTKAVEVNKEKAEAYVKEAAAKIVKAPEKPKGKTFKPRANLNPAKDA